MSVTTTTLLSSGTYLYIGCKDCGKLLIDPKGVSQIYSLLNPIGSTFNTEKTTFLDRTAYIPDLALPPPWAGIFSSRQGFRIYKPEVYGSGTNFDYGSFKITFESRGEVTIEKEEHSCPKDRSKFLGMIQKVDKERKKSLEESK